MGSLSGLVHAVKQVHANDDVRPAKMTQKAEEGAWQTNLRGAAEEGGLSHPRPASWWTGPDPSAGGVAGQRPDGTLTSLPLPVRGQPDFCTLGAFLWQPAAHAPPRAGRDTHQPRGRAGLL